ncbi:hypothetical protein K435DRAFT_812622 [Dendrothele bispora CBS 962.96]|uniref:Ribonuclease H1 N-terminal domain-containing protein n=1 Tax=Dendrothele bispora (strain CBS 962.96) TaxID=1314807 RepID=A0A4S8KPM1_DENBC|nr:hypothetical protein K435DRAFT_812622 [Dendrothele bispora CBS 962.96]
MDSIFQAKKPIHKDKGKQRADNKRPARPAGGDSFRPGNSAAVAASLLDKQQQHEKCHQRITDLVQEIGSLLALEAETSVNAEDEPEPPSSDDESLNNSEFYDTDGETELIQPPSHLRAPPPSYQLSPPKASPSTPKRSTRTPFQPNTSHFPTNLPVAGPSTSGHASVTTPRAQRQPKKWEAYAVYKGKRIGVFKQWSSVLSSVSQDSHAVYKGFQSSNLAHQSFDLVRTSGILELLAYTPLTGEPWFVVTRGVAPGVYYGYYAMMRDGLYWASGAVHVSNTKADADALFVNEFMSHNVVTLPCENIGSSDLEVAGLRVKASMNPISKKVFYEIFLEAKPDV